MLAAFLPESFCVRLWTPERWGLPLSLPIPLPYSLLFCNLSLSRPPCILPSEFYWDQFIVSAYQHSNLTKKITLGRLCSSLRERDRGNTLRRCLSRRRSAIVPQSSEMNGPASSRRLTYQCHVSRSPRHPGTSRHILVARDHLDIVSLLIWRLVCRPPDGALSAGWTTRKRQG